MDVPNSDLQPFCATRFALEIFLEHSAQGIPGPTVTIPTAEESQGSVKIIVLCEPTQQVTGDTRVHFLMDSCGGTQWLTPNLSFRAPPISHCSLETDLSVSTPKLGAGPGLNSNATTTEQREGPSMSSTGSDHHKTSYTHY